MLRKAQQQQVELEYHSCVPVSLSSAPLITLHKDFQSLSCFTFANGRKIGFGYLLFKNLETPSQKLSYFRDFKFEDFHADSLEYLETKIFIIRESSIMTLSFKEPLT